MVFDLAKVPELLPEILQVVFQELAGDYELLLNISLTCHAWRRLALPALYREVDLSSHNNGRQPQHEDIDWKPMVYADYHGDFRQRNLVPRQRAFLRTMTEKPHLARLVKSLTWTLIWRDFEEHILSDIDRQTWRVFGNMVNVSRLDLASLHKVYNDMYVRQPPAGLFPKTRHLRLLGWMPRSLVRSIIASLDASKLRSLEMDYLEDEGALPTGHAMSLEFADDNAHGVRSSPSHRRRKPDEASCLEVCADSLIERQETGQAYIFPGPMWLPLHLLSPRPLDSLTHLQVKVQPFDLGTDLRSFHTTFQKTAAFVAKVRETLESLVIVFGDREGLNQNSRLPQCGTSRVFHRSFRRPWCIAMAKYFLEQQLAALNENSFPQLRKIRFEGFRCIQDAEPYGAAQLGLAIVFEAIQECKVADATFTDIKSVQGRECFEGYDAEDVDSDHPHAYVWPDEGGFPELLANS